MQTFFEDCRRSKHHKAKATWPTTKRNSLGQTAYGLSLNVQIKISLTQAQFLLNWPIYPGLLQVRPVPKVVNSWELLWQNFYRPDALPVTQRTASKHRHHWNMVTITELTNADWKSCDRDFDFNSVWLRITTAKKGIWSIKSSAITVFLLSPARNTVIVTDRCSLETGEKADHSVPDLP